MTVFSDGSGLQAIIQHLICLRLSTQGAEPQLAAARGSLWEAKALGSFVFLYHQSTQQALTNSCL